MNQKHLPQAKQAHIQRIFLALVSRGCWSISYLTGTYKNLPPGKGNPENMPLLHHFRKAWRSDTQIPASTHTQSLLCDHHPGEQGKSHAKMKIWPSPWQYRLHSCGVPAELALYQLRSSSIAVDRPLPALAAQAPHVTHCLGFLVHTPSAQPGGLSLDPHPRAQILGSRTIKLQHQSLCHFLP